MIASWGGELYFVYLPEWRRYAKNVDQGNFNQRDQILSILRKLDIPIIDLHQTFLKQSNPLVFFPFKMLGHYNKDGYKLVADTIRNRLPDYVSR